jgi:hypothetical protein
MDRRRQNGAAMHGLGKMLFSLSVWAGVITASFAGSKEKWQRLETNTGLVIAIDLSSIERAQYDLAGMAKMNKEAGLPVPHSDGRPRFADAIVCVDVDNNTCAPLNMKRLRFDCHGHFMDVHGTTSLMMPAPPRSVAGQLAAIACGTAEPPATTRPDIEATTANKPATLVDKYVAVAATPCSTLLNLYGTESFYPLIDPVIQFMSAMENGFGSTINITDFVLTECRLNESFTIQEAVTDLFHKKQQGQLPQIPIGGATTEPRVQAAWDAFDKWIHHRGPPPDFGR